FCSVNTTRRLGSRYGSWFSSTALMTLKIAVFAPMPSTSVRSATAVNVGCRTSDRTAYRTSPRSRLMATSLPVPASHRAEEFEHQVRGQDGRDLARPVEERRHLDDVAADQLEACEPANQPLRLVAREAADFRRAGSRRERRIDGIDVERHVRRAGDHASDCVDDPVDAARFRLIDVDHGDAVLAMEVEIVLAVHRAADSDLDEAAAVDDLLLDRAAERRAVKVLAAEVLVPRVDVRVELDERERSVLFRERAQNRQRDGVVAAGDDRPRAGCGDCRNARLDRVVRLLDAYRRRVDVADVRDVQAIERRDLLEIVVRPDERRLRTDLARSEPRPATVRRSAVVRHADDRDIEAFRILDVRQPHERRRLREARSLERGAGLMCHAVHYTASGAGTTKTRNAKNARRSVGLVQRVLRVPSCFRAFVVTEATVCRLRRVPSSLL